VRQGDQAQTVLSVARQTFQEASSQLLQAQAQKSMALAAKESATANFQASQSKLGEAQHTVDNLETLMAERPNRAAKVQQPELSLQWCYVRAPFDGYVTNMNISQGAYAHVGTPMFTLFDTSKWWVLASYRESKLETPPARDARRGLPDGAPLPGVSMGWSTASAAGSSQKTEPSPTVDRTLNWVHPLRALSGAHSRHQPRPRTLPRRRNRHHYLSVRELLMATTRSRTSALSALSRQS
jgi:multidrug efflux system membrane fusion protein